jgi:hypothetical protein
VAVVVKRDVQVGTDEDALALGFPLGAQIGEADDVHGEEILVFMILGGRHGNGRFKAVGFLLASHLSVRSLSPGAHHERADGPAKSLQFEETFFKLQEIFDTMMP